MRLVRVAAASDTSEAVGDDCGDATRAGDCGARLLASAATVTAEAVATGAGAAALEVATEARLQSTYQLQDML